LSHRFTAPLLADPDGLPVYSAGYRLIEVVHTFTSLRLYRWQQDLIIRILEQCPPGHPKEGRLRYRQVVVSMARQNGKSVIASVLALYGLLLHNDAPRVLGVASTAEQAGIVYDYAAERITESPVLRKLLKARGTATLGISRADGRGNYVVRTSKSNSLQGYPSTLAIVDELHILESGTFQAIVKSQTAQINPLIVGITTAGDISSVLLKRLYERGQQALAGTDESFGFFVWEADSDEFTVENIAQANPNVLEGVKDVHEIYDDEKHELPADQRRYTLNRFVDGLAEPWLPPEAWAKCAGTGLTDFTDAFYAIEIHGNYECVSIYAAKKIDGIVKTAVVARLVKPSQEDLQEWATRIKRAGRCKFVMDGYRKTKTLANWLDTKGSVIRIGNGGSRVEAASMTYAAVMRQEVEHDNTALVNKHHSTAVMKKDFLAGTEIDMAVACVFAIYAALTNKRRVISVA